MSAGALSIKPVEIRFRDGKTQVSFELQVEDATGVLRVSQQFTKEYPTATGYGITQGQYGDLWEVVEAVLDKVKIETDPTAVLAVDAVLGILGPSSP